MPATRVLPPRGALKSRRASVGGFALSFSLGVATPSPRSCICSVHGAPDGGFPALDHGRRHVKLQLAGHHTMREPHAQWGPRDTAAWRRATTAPWLTQCMQTVRAAKAMPMCRLPDTKPIPTVIGCCIGAEPWAAT